MSGLVARALSRSALIDAYFISRLVASGYVWPLGEPDGYEELRTSMHEGFGSRGWWFDTSHLSAEQTAELILDEGAARALVKR